MKWPLLTLYGSLLLFWLGVSAPTIGAAESGETEGRGVLDNGVNAASGKSTVVSKLPEGVHGEAGQVTLVVDFDKVNGHEAVPVYLINRSQQALTLGVESGDIYLKQEALDKTGRWSRSQSHEFSFCGLSYSKITLRPGHFLCIPGFQAPEGRFVPVRYRLYNQTGLAVTSNEGMGWVSRREANLASEDFLALKDGSLAFVRKAALRWRFFKPRKGRVSQDEAIAALADERFLRTDVEPVLREIAAKFPGKRKAIAEVRERRDWREQRFPAKPQ